MNLNYRKLSFKQYMGHGIQEWTKSFYGKIWVHGNPYSSIFYAVTLFNGIHTAGEQRVNHVIPGENLQ